MLQLKKGLIQILNLNLKKLNEKTFRDRGSGFMSEIDKKEIQDLEDEYEEELAKYYREKKYFYYAKIGSLLGIVFIALSGMLNDEFYRLFGTFFMSIIYGIVGMCILFTIMSMLPGFKEDEKFKWDILENQRLE